MGLFDFLKGKNKKDETLNNTMNDSQKEFIKDMSTNANRICEAYNKMLDGSLNFSIESLSALDELLEQFHQNRNDVDNEMKNDLICQAGGYIFEVARRKFGGKYYWLDQSSQQLLVTGQPKFEISITAYEKVKMRIENGKEDAIPFYFKGYVERVTKGKVGDKTLIN